MNARVKGPSVAIELDALEEDIEALNRSMLEILDVAFSEPNAREPLLKALEGVHSASFSLRHWIGAEAGVLDGDGRGQ